MMRLLLIGLWGAAGSIMRYRMQQCLNDIAFPYGTFIVNISGCLLIGLLAGVAAKNGLSAEIVALMMTGFCGGFTTLSAFSLESIQLFKTNVLSFTLYTIGTVVLSLMCTFIGYKIGS